MATAGADKHYKFGSKNNWRRTIWNEVLRRTNGREKDLPILYLAGPQDLDREVAVKKGVPERNLIAIDRDRRNVDAVRGRRSAAICADAANVLWSWPETQPVAAVLLDLCGGFSLDAGDMYDAVRRPPFLGAVVMFNMLRGRDASTNHFRDAMDAAERAGVISVESLCQVERKHRGAQLLVASTMRDWWDSALVEGVTITPAQLTGLKVVVSDMVARVNPKFWTYRSGVLAFDSVVYQEMSLDGLLRGLDDLKRNGGMSTSECEELESQAKSLWSDIKKVSAGAKDKQTVKKIGAMLAVRTMRERGTLPCRVN